MTKKIVWRLPNRPTPEEVRGLLKDGIVTKDEAREILFNLEDTENRDVKSLESEIKFLRSLVENLASNRQAIVTTIKEVEHHYQKQPWFKPYEVWCGGNSLYATGTSGTMYLTANSANTVSTTDLTSASWNASDPMGFTDIKSF